MAKESFKATLSIVHNKDTVMGTGYDKDKVIEYPSSRDVVSIELTADTLEKLQSKLVAHIGLAE